MHVRIFQSTEMYTLHLIVTNLKKNPPGIQEHSGVYKKFSADEREITKSILGTISSWTCR